MKFLTEVFGCQMNYADAARIRSMLQYCGWTETKDESEADIVIFVTCSVRAKSEDKITGRLKQVDRNTKIRITGCMPQHFLRNTKVQNNEKKIADQLKVGNFIGNASQDATIIGWDTSSIRHKTDEQQLASSIIPVNNAFNPLFYRLNGTFKNVELIFRIDDTGLLPLIISQLGYEVDTSKIKQYDEYTEILPQATTMIQTGDSTKTAFVPISTGCSQFCSYCIVPYARGLEKHLDIDTILQEAKHHADNGIQEITLLGQIVNKHPRFVDIISGILKNSPDLKWLRYTSPYPTYYSDELLALHQQESKLCPHIHIPVQSGSDSVLKRMHRGYTVAQFKEMIDKVHNLKRDINITTDIIVGFSGETDEDFKQTLDLVKYAKFSMIYIGKYSVRPGTYGANHLVDDVPQHIKDERRATLNDLLLSIALQNNQKEIGLTREIMVSHVRKGMIKGHTDSLKNVTITCNTKDEKYKHIQRGHFATVKIHTAESMMLHADLI